MIDHFCILHHLGLNSLYLIIDDRLTFNLSEFELTRLLSKLNDIKLCELGQTNNQQD